MKEKINKIIEEHKSTLEGKNNHELKGMMLEEAQKQAKFQTDEDMLSILEGMIKLVAIGRELEAQQ